MASEYRDYLVWLHRSTRISVHPPALSIPIHELESDDEDLYDALTRVGVQLERAPLQNYIVSISIQKYAFSYIYICNYAATMIMDVL